jgi:hypothetical protein
VLRATVATRSVDGGTGSDVIDGAAGQDRIEHNQLAAGVRLALATTTPQNQPAARASTR